jgi:hypothetical protein
VFVLLDLLPFEPAETALPVFLHVENELSRKIVMALKMK